MKIEIETYLKILVTDCLQEGWIPTALRIHPVHWNGYREFIRMKNGAVIEKDVLEVKNHCVIYRLKVIEDERLSSPFLISKDRRTYPTYEEQQKILEQANEEFLPPDSEPNIDQTIIDAVSKFKNPDDQLKALDAAHAAIEKGYEHLDCVKPHDEKLDQTGINPFTMTKDQIEQVKAFLREIENREIEERES